jgi:flagellar operon protein
VKDISLQRPTQPAGVQGLREMVRPDAKAPTTGPVSFQNVLSTLQSETVGKPAALVQPRPPLQFSSHAVDRMKLRGLSFDANELGKIQDAVGKASAKGAQNTLVLTDKSALIVAIKNNTVVTVMDKAQMKENVFTNIDSTVVI